MYQLFKRLKFIDIDRDMLEKEYRCVSLKIFEKSIRSEGRLGSYYRDVEINRGYAIEIDKSIPNYAKMFTFFHEKGHHLCAENRCYCHSFSKQRCESHADLYALKECFSKRYLALQDLNFINRNEEEEIFLKRMFSRLIVDHELELEHFLFIEGILEDSKINRYAEDFNF